MTKIITAVGACLAFGPLALGSLAIGGGAEIGDSAWTPTARASADSIAPAVVIDIPDRVAVSLTPRVYVSGADSGDLARLDEALTRFREFGLALPDLDVRFHGDQAVCRGHYGLFQRSFTPWRVLICSDLGFVPSHELAHAWEAANLTDDDRDSYVETRGLATWDDPEAGWNDRGVEDMAFMLQQNLMANNPRLTAAHWIERIAAYELITGRPSPLYTAG